MSARFVAEGGALRGLVLVLEGGDEWTIGRDPDECDLTIEDPKCSRRHLVCRKTEDGIILENLSSTNPVKINDQPTLVPSLLHEGDRVTIGSTHFRFHQDTESFSESEVFEEPFEGETIYREEESADLTGGKVDLTPGSRFVLKVVAGPNTGAEFTLDYDREYVIGTDPLSADIIFHDLSVSRQHARLTLNPGGHITIEDLGSRNGIVIDRKRIEEKTVLHPNSLVALGTSLFTVIDKEAPLQTIMTPEFEEKEEERLSSKLPKEEISEPILTPVAAPKSPFVLPTGPLILTAIFACLVILLGIGAISLLRTKDVTIVKQDFDAKIREAIKSFPEVKFTFSPNTEKVLLIGHVTNGIRKNELLYNLRALCFIKGIEDNVVDDEAVWQEMNILLSKIPTFQGVSMHSPAPGVFVLTGFLKTNQQLAQLNDYMNLNFNYIERLENHVLVEEHTKEEIANLILQYGYSGITFEFINGQLVLTGYVASGEMAHLEELVKRLETFNGIKSVRNYVVALSPEQAVIDLNERYPGRYQLTGYSKHCDVNINVVVNGRILMRGDAIDGMTITSIQSRTVFLEKDGLKFKLEYNK